MIANKSQIKYTINLFIERKRNLINNIYSKYSNFDYISREDDQIISKTLSDIEMFLNLSEKY